MPGTFSLMLHSHIPYCRKSGVWPAGEEWLFEAMHETYIPLLTALKSLLRDGIRPQVMVGLVPVLMEQLADPYMQGRFCDYLEDKLRRAREDARRFQAEPQRRDLARYWEERFEGVLRAFTDDFYRDILGTLKWLQEEGAIEVLTSAATHGFLPLLQRDSAIHAQVHLGVETYRRYFGRPPRGFWLPECAYRPAEAAPEAQRQRRGLDEWLALEGIEYTFVEGVGLERATFVDNRHAEEKPTTFRGYRLPSGLAVFGRNQETGAQVWSPDRGYPGDPYYLEFHIKDPDSGLRYWRVTGEGDKQLYDPGLARGRLEVHARHFADLVAETLARAAFPEAVIVAPYDCELFGHWWHEGVDWLERVCRLLAASQDVAMHSLGPYLDQHREGLATVSMSPSTWGVNADFTVWQNPEHGWIWPYINASSLEMELILNQARPADARGERILRQMGRELLLMQGSDWPFLLYTTQAKEYANQRFHHHHQRFLKLLWAARDLTDQGRLSEEELQHIEDVDCPWQDLDYRLFEAQD